MSQVITPEIDVSNLEESLKFYVELLRFELSFTRPEEKFAYLRLNGAGLMLEQIGAGRSFHEAPLERLYGRGVNFQIRVDDFVSCSAACSQQASRSSYRWQNAGIVKPRASGEIANS